jgi:cysteinyl-tRNA synthetase
VADDHVLFSVPSMADYGKLSKRSLDEMIAGARIDVAPYKRDPMDFVLWKPSKPREPAWPSPSGIATPGRPGWHIECSAMAWKHLGETFDIHGGGIDLVFPHHENEIAQSRCAFHSARMAQVWMHNGFLQVEGEKMAKSTGNFVTIRELLADWPGEVIRLAMLQTHYRQPIDWTLRRLEESSRTMGEWAAHGGDTEEAEVPDALIEALTDDLNTPKALAELHQLHRSGGFAKLAAALRLIGISDAQLKGSALLKGKEIPVDPPKIEHLIIARNAARKTKNFAEADRIRDELAASRVELEDHKDGTTTWKVKR